MYYSKERQKIFCLLKNMYSNNEKTTTLLHLSNVALIYVSIIMSKRVFGFLDYYLFYLFLFADSKT